MKLNSSTRICRTLTYDDNQTNSQLHYHIIVTIRANNITSSVDILMYVKFSCNGV